MLNEVSKIYTLGDAVMAKMVINQPLTTLDVFALIIPSSHQELYYVPRLQSQTSLT